jgi:hypothetical protein
MVVKYYKWSYNIAAFSIPPKFTKIGVFGMKPSGNLNIGRDLSLRCFP